MLLIIHSPSIRDFSCTLYKAQELRRRFVGATRSMQGNYCPYHWRPVLNVTASLWTNNVLTSQMNLNILNWAILPCKPQYNTGNQRRKSNFFFLWDCFYLKIKSQKEGLPAGQLGMFFLSAKDENLSPGTGHCRSTALMIPNSNFILKTIFCRSIQV